MCTLLGPRPPYGIVLDEAVRFWHDVDENPSQGQPISKDSEMFALSAVSGDWNVAEWRKKSKNRIAAKENLASAGDNVWETMSFPNPIYTSRTI